MEPVKALEEFLKIYSPSGKEDEAIAYLNDLLKSCGIKTKIHERNLLGEFGKGELKILLCGHVDTVPGYIPYRKQGDLIYARGAVDAKSSLLALIFSALNLNENDFKIRIACTVGEESEDSGITKINNDFLKADFAIFGEPSNLDGIVVGYRGRIGLRVLSETKKTHASIASENPIYQMADFIKEIQRIQEEYENEKQFYSVTINPVIIRAGIANNVIPDSCEAIFDIRIPPSIKLDELKKKIEGISPLKVEWISYCEPVLANKNSALVIAFKKSIAKKLKRRPRIVLKTGSSDMNYYANKFGSNCISYGPGDPKYEHAEIEMISIKEYLKAIEIISDALNNLTK